MKYLILFITILWSSAIFSQNLTWELVVDGVGVSSHQDIQSLDFEAGPTVTSFSFVSTGAYAKTWSEVGLDTDKYFQVAFKSNSLDTFELNTIEYSERRSGTGIRDYELRYSKAIDFQTFTSMGIVSVPDNDLERDTTIHNVAIKIYPNDVFYLR